MAAEQLVKINKLLYIWPGYCPDGWRSCGYTILAKKQATRPTQQRQREPIPSVGRWNEYLGQSGGRGGSTQACRVIL